MKYVLISSAALLGAQPAAQAQSLADILRGMMGATEVKAEPTSTEEASTVSSRISSMDADAGLRQALTLGAEAVGAQLSAENGYFKDKKIHIPLPGKLGKLQSQLSRFGLSGQLDDLELRLNRAAEASAPKAADLVIKAVQALTIDDAVSLLQGGDTAATDLLRKKTEYDLRVLMKPYVEETLSESGTIRLLDQTTTQYGAGKLGNDLQADLVDHAVEEGLDGLFFYLAKEEQDIRKNPVKRSTDLLRRVFGG